MEEIKEKQEEKKQQEMTYEQLKSYYNATIAQSKHVLEENNALKQALRDRSTEYGLSEINIAMKCLDHAEMFSSEFIKALVKRIEDSLTPITEENTGKEE